MRQRMKIWINWIIKNSSKQIPMQYFQEYDIQIEKH